ncbi:MAG: dipeptidase, partial [Thermoanaerobaculales bacterium]|nr:dipeptidase [Thermoanaerobaculales bacterium]
MNTGIRCAVLAVVAAFVFGISGAPAAEEETPAPSPEQQAVVREVLQAVPLIDGHNDAPWAIRSRVANQIRDFDFIDTTTLEEPMHTDIERLREGGVGGQFWSVWVPTSLDGPEAVVTVLEQIDLVNRLVEKYPNDLAIAHTADDIVRIHSDGKIASLIGVEGGHSIDSSLAVLRQLFAVGARYMTLTHWSNVPWADAATDA